MDTQERPYTAAIKTLKERIKGLAEVQKKNKLARKTKRIDPDLRKKLLEELGIRYPEFADAEVRSRAAKITAHLNLYLELRGKEYRHKDPEGYWSSDYGDAMMRLLKEFSVK